VRESLNPGLECHTNRVIRWVVTDLGNAIALAIGMKKASITEEESAIGVFEQVSSLLYILPKEQCLFIHTD
jgi:hypothetical protein